MKWAKWVKVTCIYKDEIQMAKHGNGNLVDNVKTKFAQTYMEESGCEFTLQLTHILEQLWRSFGRSQKRNLFHKFSSLTQPSFEMQLVEGALERGNNNCQFSFLLLFLFQILFHCVNLIWLLRRETSSSVFSIMSVQMFLCTLHWTCTQLCLGWVLCLLNN